VSALEQELAQLQDCANDSLLPYAWGRPLATADFRCRPEDFCVRERGFIPSGAGEHLVIRARKLGQNTRWVAKQFAERLGLPYRSVSYAGLKDRNAITEQWFSIHLPGQSDPDPAQLAPDGVEILELNRHDRKLRPGQLSYNEFDIRLRNVCTLDNAWLDERLAVIAARGVPNFFGPQRFGRSGANLDLSAHTDTLAVLPREQRSFVISALRSALFNGYLAGRVATDSWSEPLEGEVTISDRDRGLAEEDTSLFEACRLPTGLLWGCGYVAGNNPAGERETEWYNRYPLTTGLLHGAGSKQARRVLVCRVAALQSSHEDGALRLQFALSSGAYATTVLREIVNLTNVSQITE